MPENEPQDVFAQVSSTPPVAEQAASGKPEFLHFDEVALLIATAETYVQETRADLEHNNTPEQWIEDLMQTVLAAKQYLQLLEADSVEDPVLWTDESGVEHEVMMRDQNKKGFDKFLVEFTKVQVGFDSYFKRHVAHLKALKQ